MLFDSVVSVYIYFKSYWGMISWVIVGFVCCGIDDS